MSQQTPIDACEPFVLFNFTRPTLTSHSLVLVFAKESLDDALADSGSCGMIGKSGLVAKNVAKSRMPVRAFERSTAIKHLEDQDTESPPVIAI